MIFSTCISEPITAQTFSCSPGPVAVNCLKSNVQYKCILGAALLGSQIAMGNLLPMPAAATTPQFIVIETSLTINSNYTFAPGSEIVMAPNAEIEIVNIIGFTLTTLTLNGTDVYGCSAMWKEIELLDKTKIVVNSSNIADAIAAIRAKANATIELDDNDFINCSKSVYFGTFNTLSPSFYSLNQSINNCRFLKTGSLKPPFAGASPVSAIELYNVTNLQTFHSLIPSTIDGHDTGFLLSTVQADLKGWSISNGNIGISIGSNALENSLWFEGFGSCASCPTAFNNLTFGILSSALENLVVKNTKAQTFFEEFINESGNFPAYPCNISITGNRIIDYNIGGLNINSKNSSTKVFIDNNVFQDSNNPFSVNVPSIGLRYYDFNNDWVNDFTVSNNSFLDNNIGPFASSDTKHQMNLRRISKPKILGNTINTTDGINALQNISVSLCNKPVITNNTVNGAGGLKSIGILVSDCQSGVYRCNFSTSSTNGIEFKNDCDNSLIKQNEMNVATNGLFLSTQITKTGIQNDGRNQWPGLTSTTEARHSGLGPNIFMSEFWVLPAEAVVGNSLWPIPVNPAGWFVPNGTNQPYGFCTGDGENLPPSGLTKADELIIAGTYPNTYPSDRWDASINLFTRLNENPLLMPNASLAQTWYNNNISTSVGKIFFAEKQATDLLAPTTAESNQISAYKMLLSVKSDSINLLYQLINNTQNQATLHVLFAKIELLNQTINLINNNISTFGNQIKANNAIEASAVMGLLNSINVNDSWEDYRVNVNKVPLEMTILGTNIMSNAQVQLLTNISNLCRISNGIAVSMARSMMKMEVDDNNACLPPPAPLTSTSQNNSNALTVQPNPAFDDITILSNTFLIKKVQLFNLLGQFMTSKENINNIQTQLSVSQLPEASYLLRIELENGELISKQVIIKK